MSKPTPPETRHREGDGIRRILVALDASRPSRTALEAAVDLAAKLQADLQALFVEDINLVRLAQLPFTREVGLSSAARRPLDSLRLEESLRAQVSMLARQIAAAAARHRVSGELRVVRGAVAEEVLAAAQDADLLVVGRRSGAGIGRNLRLILQRAERVMLTGDAVAAPAVLVVFDGEEPAYRALAAAAQLADPERDELVVLLAAPPGSAEAASLQELATLWLARQHRSARFRPCRQAVARELWRAVAEEGARLVVAAAELAPGSPQGLDRLLSQLRCSLVLVRREAPAGG